MKLNTKQLKLVEKKLSIEDSGYPDVVPDDYREVYSEFLKTQIANDIEKRYGSISYLFLGLAFYSYIKKLTKGSIDTFKLSLGLEDFQSLALTIKTRLSKYTNGLAVVNNECKVLTPFYNKMINACADVKIVGYVQYTTTNQSLDSYIESNLKNNFKVLPFELTSLQKNGKTRMMLPYFRLKNTNRDWYLLEENKDIKYKIKIARARFDYLVMSYEIELSSVFFLNNKTQPQLRYMINNVWKRQFKL